MPYLTNALNFMEARKPEPDVEKLEKQGREDMAVMLREAHTDDGTAKDRLEKIQRIVGYYHLEWGTRSKDPAKRIEAEARRGMASDVWHALSKLNGASVDEKLACVRGIVEKVITSQ